MIAALLLNEPYPGGVPDEEHERAQRALERLREEHFEREKRRQREQILQDMDAATALADRPDNVYRIPTIDKSVPDAELKSRVDDDEVLAFLLILTEL